MEIPKWAALSDILSENIEKFQSFFWWKSRNGSANWLLTKPRATCFNPSFDGNPEMGRLWFQRRSASIFVSILLLMEIPKWESMFQGRGKWKRGFNPSFDGNPEMGNRFTGVLNPSLSFNPSFDGNPEMGDTQDEFDVLEYAVSILLLMEIPKWDSSPNGFADSGNGFQSFFWWKSRNGCNWVLPSAFAYDGFNPSFDGNPEMGFRLPYLSGPHLPVSILLLMEIPKWGVHRGIERRRKAGFNPSFDGNPEMGRPRSNRPGDSLMFQSFFWWKSRNGMGIPSQKLRTFLVSILLLMEIPKWDLPIISSSSLNIMFQSFFWWKSRNGNGWS